MKKIKIGALISGGGSNLQAIIDACEIGKIDGEVVFVGSDRPGVKGLERAKKHGIPWFIVNYAELMVDFQNDGLPNHWPEDCDWAELLQKQNFSEVIDSAFAEKLKIRVMIEALLWRWVNSFQFDLLVLAGFMRVLSPYFIDKVNTDPEHPRIMNIHPALLPSFPGTDGYGDTYAYGCKVGGCTVHFVDYGEDTGPIIGQRAYQILPGESLDDIKRKGLALEWQLYPECIQLFAQGRLKVVERKMEGKKPRKVVELLPWPKEDN